MRQGAEGSGGLLSLTGRSWQSSCGSGCCAGPTTRASRWPTGQPSSTGGVRTLAPSPCTLPVYLVLQSAILVLVARPTSILTRPRQSACVHQATPSKDTSLLSERTRSASVLDFLLRLPQPFTVIRAASSNRREAVCVDRLCLSALLQGR